MNDLESAIKAFQNQLPFTAAPYNGRNWGHPLHSLCSYQGKFKPALAHWLVRTFVPEGGRVLDPLGGVGTVPFEAALMGRHGVANDLSPLAATVAMGKLRPPSLSAAHVMIKDFEARLAAVDLTDDDYESATFGLNGAVKDYYHPETLTEVLRARALFRKEGLEHDSFIWASVLHILHGNRPYALSRTSHPITPFNPTGPFEYRSLIDRVYRRVNNVLKTDLPAEFTPGQGIHGDFRELPARFPRHFDAVITSPPFIGMRFDRPNWLRLWFCGWQAEDFHQRSLGFLERQQTKSRDCYLDFFSTCQKVLTDQGLLIIHVGSGGKGDLVGDLKLLSADYFDLIGEVKEDVRRVEVHGLTDKGLTTAHHLLFFRPTGR